MLKNKTKDMARSVLPSTKRKGARQDKRHAHKACRGRVRAALHDWDEDSTDELLDPQRFDNYRGIKVVVRDRRDADNVKPLMRWAEAKADDFGATPSERYKTLRALLPPNIIGWHVMTHVEYLEPFQRNLTGLWRYRPYDRREVRRKALARKENLCVALRGNADLFGKLNAFLKTKRKHKWVWNDETASLGCVVIELIRPLAGIHDIEDFVEALKWDQIELIEDWLKLNRV